jgi:hypothetical protein
MVRAPEEIESGTHGVDEGVVLVLMHFPPGYSKGCEFVLASSPPVVNDPVPMDWEVYNSDDCSFQPTTCSNCKPTTIYCAKSLSV